MHNFANVLLFTAIALLPCIAFFPEPISADEGDFTFAESDVSRDMDPDVTESQMDQAVRGNTDFALDLYHVVGEEPGNVFYSPYSITLAFGMTFTGARENTADEMADVMHFTLPEDVLHPALNALQLEIAGRAEEVPGTGVPPLQLNVVNSMWGQQDYEYLQPFLDTIGRNYGAGLRLVDFASDPERCRQIINGWVEEQTEEKIPELIAEDIIDSLTRLVLVNAIYFKATWLHKFEEEYTEDSDFHLFDGDSVTVPMMEQTESFRYTEGDGWQAVELLYYGTTNSMLIILPEEGRFEEIESGLDSDFVTSVVDSFDFRQVHLKMPTFKLEGDLPLSESLQELGMVDAFDMNTANFAGIDGNPGWLYIKAALHKAFVSVDEEGTEAAAATAVIIAGRGGPPITEPVDFFADRPFIFMIRDIPTDTVLFLGRLMNPAS